MENIASYLNTDAVQEKARAAGKAQRYSFGCIGADNKIIGIYPSRYSGFEDRV